MPRRDCAIITREELSPIGIATLVILKDSSLADTASELSTRVFAPNHEIYGMLYDLQELPVVRLIEGHD
ncbi:MAG: hypothetical protein ABI659_02480 [Nitrosospira sp.]